MVLPLQKDGKESGGAAKSSYPKPEIYVIL
jgi:hypothetical protein